MSGRVWALLPLTLSLGGQNRTQMTGTVRDTLEVLSHARVELRSEASPENTFMTETDAAGIYHFANVPGGRYTMKLTASGFRSVTVKSISISGLAKTIQPLELSVSSCSSPAGPEYFRLLQGANGVGDLSGTVTVELGPMGRDRRPVSADVTLICEQHSICGQTRANSSGEFAFRALKPGDYSLRATSIGYYPSTETGNTVRAGLDSRWNMSLERCPAFNCDPTLRPEKPLPICE